MTAPTPVARLWSFLLRTTILVLLEGFAARLANVRHVAGHLQGHQILLGMLAIAAVLAWPALAAGAAVAVLDSDPRDRWQFRKACGNALLAIVPSLFYFGGPLIALVFRLPQITIHLVAIVAIYCTIAAATGCLLARGVAPWSTYTGRRVLRRAAVIYTLAALLVVRQWQPEDTLIPLFPVAGTLVFPFAQGGRHVYASADLLVAPAHPIPALNLPANAAPVGGAFALVVLMLVAAIWATPPSEGAVDPRRRQTADLLPGLLSFTGCLILTSQNLSYLNQVNAFARAWALTVGEMFMLVALMMVLAELAPLCARRSYPLFVGALCCFHGAATLGTDLFWYANSIISAVWIISFVTTAVAAAHVFRWIADRAPPASSWGVQLLVGSPLVSACLLTDATFFKLQTRVGVPDPDLLLIFWWATKAGLCALALFVAWYIPHHFSRPTRR